MSDVDTVGRKKGSSALQKPNIAATASSVNNEADPAGTFRLQHFGASGGPMIRLRISQADGTCTIKATVLSGQSGTATPTAMGKLRKQRKSRPFLLVLCTVSLFF